MRKLLILFLVPLFSACDYIIGEQGNGEIITETHSIDDFDELDISGMFDVVLEPGKPLVTITGDENLMQWIEVRSDGDALVIDSEKRLRSEHGIKIVVHYEELEEINTTGASNIIAEETIFTDRLRVLISGAGKTDLSVAVESIDVEMSGAAVIYLSGVAEVFRADLSGAGSIEAFELESENCELSISGAGSASVNVTGDLEAEVSGVGGVEYLGNPKNVHRDVSGVGSIKQAKE